MLILLSLELPSRLTMSLIIPRLEGLSLQGYSVLNFFFNVSSKNRSPNPSLSGEHGAIYTLSLNAAYRMNLKPQLCICHPTHDQVDSAHLQQLAVFYVFFFSQYDRHFRHSLAGLAEVSPAVRPSFCLARRATKVSPQVHLLKDFGEDEE
jgi:hypothetical protein